MYNLEFIEIVDKEPEDSSRALTGGDYREGRIVVTSYGVPIAVHHFTSCQIASYCHCCGRYQCDGNCGDPTGVDFAGLATGKVLKESEAWYIRFTEDFDEWFVMRSFQLRELREIFRAIAQQEVAAFYPNKPDELKPYNEMTRDEYRDHGVYDGARLASRAIDSFLANIIN